MARIRHDDPTELARQVLVAKGEEKSIKARLAELRERLFGVIDAVGEEDDKGSLFVAPSEDSGVKEITKQRRVSVSVDQGALEKLLRDKGLYEECSKTITVVDEDAVNAAVFEGKISEAEFAACVQRKVSWALVVK